MYLTEVFLLLVSMCQLLLQITAISEIHEDRVDARKLLRVVCLKFYLKAKTLESRKTLNSNWSRNIEAERKTQS